LTSQTANLPIEELLKQAAGNSVEVLDMQGNVIAYVLSPVDREALIYAEAKLDYDRHPEELRQALGRRGGITTQQLLEKAQAATPADSQS
jgi:hypothetical protein